MRNQFVYLNSKNTIVVSATLTTSQPNKIKPIPKFIVENNKNKQITSKQQTINNKNNTNKSFNKTKLKFNEQKSIENLNNSFNDIKLLNNNNNELINNNYNLSMIQDQGLFQFFLTKFKVFF